MNFDLEDGLPPVSFTLKPADCQRFMEFMAECTDAIKNKQAAPTPPANTWRTNGDTCLNCGKRITQHEDQTFCPTPPAQEAEPFAYYVRTSDMKGFLSFDKFAGVECDKLYTHAPSEKLRQAAWRMADSLGILLEGLETIPKAELARLHVNLLAALEGKS
jgi:hypothetical protein